MSGQLPLLVELLEGSAAHLEACLVELICNCAELPAAIKVGVKSSLQQLFRIACDISLGDCFNALLGFSVIGCCGYRVRLLLCSCVRAVQSLGLSIPRACKSARSK